MSMNQHHSSTISLNSLDNIGISQKEEPLISTITDQGLKIFFMNDLKN